MAAYRFHIAKPDQLQSLVPMVKDNPASVARVARIWKAAKEKRGETRWDTGVYVGFSGDRAREAVLFRVATGDELVTFGTLKYNLALRWCERHLRQVYD